jgi:CBS domain-containing protein
VAQGRVPVVDAGGALVGSLTADGILAGLRRAAEAAVPDARAAGDRPHAGAARVAAATPRSAS